MNYFFLTSNNNFGCQISIPKFTNDGYQDHAMGLVRASIVDQKWCFQEHSGPEDGDFWEFESSPESAGDIFFIATKEQLRLQQNSRRLLDLNTYTNTVPDYRCNGVFNDPGGFSSSIGIPLSMATRKGAIF